MICSPIYYRVSISTMKKLYILSIKYDYLILSHYLVLHFKINIVHKMVKTFQPPQLQTIADGGKVWRWGFVVLKPLKIHDLLNVMLSGITSKRTLIEHYTISRLWVELRAAVYNFIVSLLLTRQVIKQVRESCMMQQIIIS